MSSAPSVLNIHTPISSFAIIHSLTQDSLLSLYDTLSRKQHTDYYGERVGPGWLKYEYNDAIWNLDDESDYAIFAWRQQEAHFSQQEHPEQVASTSRMVPSIDSVPKERPTPTLHLHNHAQPLPRPTAYRNPSYYLFQPSHAAPYARSTRSPVPSRGSKRSKKSKNVYTNDGEEEDDGIPKHKKEFERFHSENGVRTVLGSIGPVQNVRMLLKAGYRHVYISRKFAIKHGFIPADAAPGNYGYGGLVNIGSWPITLTPSASNPGSSHLRPDNVSHSQFSSPRIPGGSPPHMIVNGDIQSSNPGKKGKTKQKERPSGPQPVTIEVYLSEEPHFDVVLGRSFFEKRQVKITSIDPTDVVCLDNGEKIECELVILKDGRGEIVTVT